MRRIRCEDVFLNLYNKLLPFVLYLNATETQSAIDIPASGVPGREAAGRVEPQTETCAWIVLML